MKLKAKVLLSLASAALPAAALTVPQLPAGATGAVPHVAIGGHRESVIVYLRTGAHGLPHTFAARSALVRVEQRPILAELGELGARRVVSLPLVDAVTAEMSHGAIAALRANPAVAKVIRNGVIPGPNPLEATSEGAGAPAVKAAMPSTDCDENDGVETDPEALGNINALGAQAEGYDGAGVTVAFLADGLDPTDPDFQRNSDYASTGSPADSPVVTEEDFSSDGIDAPTAGGEAFLDASSIAAQGNDTYNIGEYAASDHPIDCEIRIVGVAPGSNVLALKVFAQDNDTTTSAFIQAIEYAVANGAKVINESFGSNNFPDTTLDAVRDADDAAVAAGVTVVVSSGDAGSTSTLGSPATDPNVISVGATTTFRGYEQVAYGGSNVSAANGSYIDNNISDLSSGGFSEHGNTVDLVAPGDLNWALCSADTSLYSDCTNESDEGSPIELSGGTSESSPLTAGAAADVIQAYASTHDGNDPSPALVKQILMSTATDIDAPADQQGAGLLNVEAAVNAAASMPGTSPTPDGGLLVSPNQVNVTQAPRASTSQSISVTNNSSDSETVDLSTRALTKHVHTDSGDFCMQPGTPTESCPANSGTIDIWSGYTEDYQEESFTVPATTALARLDFTADYQYTGQTSLLHVALLEPDGTYAAYSLPQGLADYADVQVSDPVAGLWHAIFFTLQDGAEDGSGTGTSGLVQWQATTSEYAPAAAISPSTLTIPAGATKTATLTLTSPSTPGDTDQSVVVSTVGGNTTTIPVTVRTLVPVSAAAPTAFSGTVTGGNGRSGAPAESNFYEFDVPKGQSDLEADFELAYDPDDVVTAFLVDPQGDTVGYSTNITTDNFGEPEYTPWITLYHDHPEAGLWQLAIDVANPVSGNELSQPFQAEIGFNQVRITGDLPTSPYAELTPGKTYDYQVSISNTGWAPEEYFVDPRLVKSVTLSLPDQNGSPSFDLPLPAGENFPYYFVPPQTSSLHASLQASTGVSFDMEYFPGDPDVSPALPEPGVKGSGSGTDHASLTLTEPEIPQGLWLINPEEVGPYPGTGAPAATATASLSAVTRAFDPAVTSSTGDLWEAANGLGDGTFAPVYVASGESATITVAITPSATPGSIVSGDLFVDDYNVGAEFEVALPNADEVGSLAYSYKVADDAQGYWEAESNGEVAHFGSAGHYGSAVGLSDHSPIVAIVPTADQDGYYLVSAAGGVFAEGDARYAGSLAGVKLPAPIVGAAANPSGDGYWLVDADGHVYPFGNAVYHGSEDWARLHETVVGMAVPPGGHGYWLATSNGDVLAFGAAVGHGSPATTGVHLAAPITGIAAAPTGSGYVLVGRDGGVFCYGSARYEGSEAGKVSSSAVAVVVTPDGRGYWLFYSSGIVKALGDAKTLGPSAVSAPSLTAAASSSA